MHAAQFQAEVAPLRNKLYRLALRITGSVHESEDVVQEVFERIWRRSSAEATAAVQNWEAMCMVMTRNLSIDKTRMKHRTMFTAMPDHMERIDAAPNPLEFVQSADSMQFMQQLMAALPEKQRSVLHLRDVEEYSYDEIADIMQITMDDVKVTLHRARKTMREQILITNTITKS